MEKPIYVLDLKNKSVYYAVFTYSINNNGSALVEKFHLRLKFNRGLTGYLGALMQIDSMVKCN